MIHIIRVATAIALLFGSSLAMADALVSNRSMQASTIMEAFVEEGVVRMELDVGFSDVSAFSDLLPDDLNEELGNPAEAHALRTKRFFEQGLVIQADGQDLKGRLVMIEPRDRIRRDPIGGGPLPEEDGQEPEKILHFVMEYPLEGQPSMITLSSVPKMSNGTSANIGFVFYHLGVAVNDFLYGVRGMTLDLDWADPWHSHFRQRSLRRTYDSPINVFLYAEPYEIRVEVVVRPLDLQPFVDLGLEGKKEISPESYGAIQTQVAEYLSRHFDLKIDGEVVEPELDRIHFLRRTLKSSTVIDPPEALSVYSAQLGVIYVVPRTGLPQEATVNWGVFPDKLEAIPVAATDEAGSLPGMIDRDDPVLRWTNYLKNPTDVSPKVMAAPAASLPAWLRPVGMIGMVVGGLLLVIAALKSLKRPRAWAGLAAGLVALGGSAWAWNAGKAARIEANDAREIVGTLLYNVYRSFDFRQEEEVYDMLAKSVDGPLLSTTYLETRRGLVLENQGGARAKVNELEVAELVPEALADGAGFQVEADWVVGGSVGHWGHIHQRRNRYRADLTVEPVDGAWKITGMTVTSEERTE